MPALFNLDTIALETGDPERAAKVSEALRKSAFGWQARAAASLDAFNKRNHKQALEDIEVALAMEDLGALQNYKGLLKLETGDIAGASEAFEKTKAMPLDPAGAFNNSGILLLRKGELEKASNELDRSIRLQRNNHAAWNNRGCVLYRLERVREAIACFEESSVMLPTTVALSNMGFSQLAIDMLNDAVQAFDQSLKIAETPETYNCKGIVLERLGRHEEALVSFKEALRMSPQFKDASDNARRVIVRTDLQKGVEHPASSAQSPPGEAIIGDKAETSLEAVSESSLREMRKQELEAMCESLGLSPRGTRADLVLRILKVKGKKPKK